jgi:hypothetical protein
MLTRAVILSTLLLPSLALAASEGVGPSGMHAVATALPAPARRPLATLKSMLEQLGDARALVQSSVTDEVSRQLELLRSARSSSLLRR